MRAAPTFRVLRYSSYCRQTCQSGNYPSLLPGCILGDDCRNEFSLKVCGKDGSRDSVSEETQLSCFVQQSNIAVG
jgi:hypothetical protein